MSEAQDATVTSGQPNLTPRQREIVILIAQDFTAKEIADRLDISPKTAEFHRQRIKEVLAVTGTAGIVRWAIRNGLIEP